MPVIANLAAKLVLQAKEFFSTSRAVGDEIKRMKTKFGEASVAGDVFRMAKGAGALAAVGLGAQMFEQMATKVADLNKQFAEGKITQEDWTSSLLKSVPVLGSVLRGLEAVTAFGGQSATSTASMDAFDAANKQLREIEESTKRTNEEARTGVKISSEVLAAEKTRAEVMKKVGEMQRAATNEQERAAAASLERRANTIVPNAEAAVAALKAAEAAKDAEKEAAKQREKDQALAAAAAEAAAKKIKDAEEFNARAVEHTLQALRDKHSELTRGAAATTAGELATKGATTSQQAEARALEQVNASLERAKQLHEQSVSPAQKLMDDIDALNVALREGAISWSDFGRAIARATAQSEMFGTGRSTTAIKAGTQEALQLQVSASASSAQNQFAKGLTRGGNPNQDTKNLDAMKAIQERSLDVLRQIAAASSNGFLD